MLKFALNAELAKLKLTYITVVKKPKLGHSRHIAQSSLPSRSSGPWLDPTSEPTIVRMHEDWILAMFTLMSSLLVSMRRVVLLSNDYGKDLARLGEIRTWRMTVIN